MRGPYMPRSDRSASTLSESRTSHTGFSTGSSARGAVNTIAAMATPNITTSSISRHCPGVMRLRRAPDAGRLSRRTVDRVELALTTARGSDTVWSGAVARAVADS